jgi:hypothetical protein
LLGHTGALVPECAVFLLLGIRFSDLAIVHAREWSPPVSVAWLQRQPKENAFAFRLIPANLLPQLNTIDIDIDIDIEANADLCRPISSKSTAQAWSQ